MAISPGVSFKITDLSTYVQEIPGTIGLICALTDKGEDNELVYISDRTSLFSGWGYPNISKYGSNYGQGLYCAYNYLGEAGSLYFMRCLPDDATLSNMRINCTMEPSDSSALLTIDYVSDINNKTTDITTAVTGSTYSKILCLIYPIGRGQEYNKLGLRITSYANPMQNGIYVLDLYERQSDGTDVIIESYDISFDKQKIGSDGSSMFIEDVLETYSNVIRAEVPDDGYELVSKIYDKDIGNVSVIKTSGSASITDNKQDFSDWEESEDGSTNYVVIAKDGKGNEIWGWLGESSGNEDDTIDVYDCRDSTAITTIQKWNGNTTSFSTTSDITYEIKKCYTDVSELFTSSIPIPLKKGSDGSLFTASGTLDTTEAKQVLANGYAGTLNGDVLNKDENYFSLVFDCGYPTDVKTEIVTLCQTRKDCVGILDNGDNSSYANCISSRENTNTYNTYYASIFESYNKVYDIFTGKDIWVSPVYHMSYILPRSDKVSEVWNAAAGFNRGTISSIKELRFNPLEAQRDQMYLRQVNPIVKFTNGTVVFGQLTSQSKPSQMQNLSVVRLVLYCAKALSEYCKYYIFEQNDEITWSTIKNEISSFLEVISKKRGLYSYTVEVGSTDYEKKTKTIHCNIELYPITPVEKFDLNFSIV